MSLNRLDPRKPETGEAPSLDEFERMARAAFRKLPEEFRTLCEDVVIRVTDFATPEIIAKMRVGSPYNLLGLFQGVGLPFRAPSAPIEWPNLIWLYRRPILAYWATHDDTLEAIVTHVLVHEIGHHFGLSDADMAAIEGAAE